MDFQKIGNIRPQRVVVTKVSSVIPKQVLPLSVIIAKLQSGNSFGINQTPLEYDGEGDDLPLVDLDFSDPLNSRMEQLNKLQDLKQKVQDEKKKSDESKAVSQEMP